MTDDSLEERVNALEKEVAELKQRLDEKDTMTMAITKTTGSREEGTLTLHEKLEIHQLGDQRWGELYPVTDRDEWGSPIYGDPKHLTAAEVAEYREKDDEHA
jgi:hypothetical protein